MEGGEHHQVNLLVLLVVMGLIVMVLVVTVMMVNKREEYTTSCDHGGVDCGGLELYLYHAGLFPKRAAALDTRGKAKARARKRLLSFISFPSLTGHIIRML